MSTQVEEVLDEVELQTAIWKITVWNDDVNSFEHVIKSFIQVLQHHPIQAEQCAMMIHLKGKAIVKTGSFDELLPLKDALIDRKIQAELNEN